MFVGVVDPTIVIVPRAYDGDGRLHESSVVGVALLGLVHVFVLGSGSGFEPWSFARLERGGVFAPHPQPRGEPNVRVDVVAAPDEKIGVPGMNEGPQRLRFVDLGAGTERDFGGGGGGGG